MLMIGQKIWHAPAFAKASAGQDNDFVRRSLGVGGEVRSRGEEILCGGSGDQSEIVCAHSGANTFFSAFSAFSAPPRDTIFGLGP